VKKITPINKELMKSIDLCHDAATNKEKDIGIKALLRCQKTLDSFDEEFQRCKEVISSESEENKELLLATIKEERRQNREREVDFRKSAPSPLESGQRLAARELVMIRQRRLGEAEK
jgi:hypothetical protein